MRRAHEGFLVEDGRAEVRWYGGYSAPLAPHKHTGGLIAHYDEVKVFRWIPKREYEDDGASRKVTADFVRRFEAPGVYGLVDPLADTVFYVGRSSNVGKRFQQHLRVDRTIRHLSKRREKEDLIYDIRTSGQKPGLVVLSGENTSEAEQWWIERLQPEFNTHGIARRPRVTPRQSYAMNQATAKGASEKYVRSLAKR